jgi:hypothetical protein
MVGRVIGKGGETIKGLQRKYHTSIQVGSQVRTHGGFVRIHVSLAAVWDASQLLIHTCWVLGGAGEGVLLRGVMVCPWQACA